MKNLHQYGLGLRDLSIVTQSFAMAIVNIFRIIFQKTCFFTYPAPLQSLNNALNGNVSKVVSPETELFE